MGNTPATGGGQAQVRTIFSATQSDIGDKFFAWACTVSWNTISPHRDKPATKRLKSSASCVSIDITRRVCNEKTAYTGVCRCPRTIVVLRFLRPGQHRDGQERR